MASKAQLRANRRNARKSTGPRTVAGKAVSRGNALRHGLVVPGGGAGLQAWIAALGEDETGFRLAAACDAIARVRALKRDLLDEVEAAGVDEATIARVARRLVTLDRYERYARTQRDRAIMRAEEVDFARTNPILR